MLFGKELTENQQSQSREGVFYKAHTVKIRDSALGLSGFVSFFLVSVSAGRLIQGEFIDMFYGPILISL